MYRVDQDHYAAIGVLQEFEGAQQARLRQDSAEQAHSGHSI